MNRWIVVAAACAFSLWSFASQAVTLEALPGSTPQTTCFSCVFPRPVGVIARDASGQPLAGVAVTFTAPANSAGSNYVGIVRFDDFCCVAFRDVTVTTGADGVAIGTVVTIYIPGQSGVVTASADGAADVAFALSSSTQRATTVAVVSGDQQTVEIGALFAAPWKVRLLDAAGQPVPNTMISFYAGGYDGTVSSASFNGNDWAFAVADADGIATSPAARSATMVSDWGFVDIGTKAPVDGEAVPRVGMAFHVVPHFVPTTSATLEPLPGSTPQTTCFSCVFPKPIGVIARGASGEPLAGVAVTFTAHTDSAGAQYVGMVRFDDFCCIGYDQVTVVTGADGVATGTALTLGLPGGTGIVTASDNNGAPDVVFALSSTTQRATTVAVVSGDEQYAQTGTPFAAPWKVRLLDEAGHPVPNTMVSFYAGGYDGTQSSAHFNGNDWAFAVADANGIASSPPAVAGAIVGDAGFVDVTTKAGIAGEVFPDVSLRFHVVPYVITTRRMTLVSAPTPSLMTGTFAVAPYVVRVVNASGQPVAGMPVAFSTDCGSAFGDAGEQVVLSDAHGLVHSALLEASVPAMCNIRINAAGVPDGIVKSMHVFDPNLVVVTPRAPWVVAKTKHEYRVVVDFTESGMPIQPASLEAVNVLRAPHAPPAGIASPPAISIVNGSATLDLRANNVPGLYDLEVVFWGPSRTRVHVLQAP